MNISLHILDPPRGTVELQLVARTKLGLEVRLRTKTTKLAIVHDALNRKRDTDKQRERREKEKERMKERQKEARGR